MRRHSYCSEYVDDSAHPVVFGRYHRHKCLAATGDHFVPGLNAKLFAFLDPEISQKRKERKNRTFG
jgi:hypothetical protein